MRHLIPFCLAMCVGIVGAYAVDQLAPNALPPQYPDCWFSATGCDQMNSDCFMSGIGCITPCDYTNPKHHDGSPGHAVDNCCCVTP